jgi:hypothetical protein
MKVSQLKENIRNIVRKKLSEATIDVTNPANETPQTKKQKIDLARRTTGNKNLGTEKDPVEFIEEAGKYTAAVIDKMSRAELIDFLGLTREEARNWSDKQLFGAARELADDKEGSIKESGTGDQPISSMSRKDMLQYIGLPSNTSEDEYSDEELRDMINDNKKLDELGDADISKGYIPTTNLSRMSRQEMLGILQLDPDTPENEISNEELRLGLKMYSDVYGDLNEKFYSDDDDVIIEDVEDIDDKDPTFKDYDSIYEIEKMDDFNANVAPGSVYQLSVEPHPLRPNLIIISQDNGQRVVVNVEDINSLIKVLQDLA